MSALDNTVARHKATRVGKNDAGEQMASCRSCFEPWPCTVVQLFDENARLRVQLAREYSWEDEYQVESDRADAWEGRYNAAMEALSSVSASPPRSGSSFARNSG